MSSWMNGQAERCGPLAAAAQVFTASLSTQRDPPNGPAGLLALADAIERHLAEPPDEEAERVFVELAGSYLAVLLCAELGQGEHTVRNGRHGLRLAQDRFFDPFAAIGRVLDADQVRAALAREVALAEDQARSAAPAPASVWRTLEAEVLPRLVGPRFFGFLEQRFSEAPVFVAKLAGQVQLAFILRSGGSARYLRKDEVARSAATTGQIVRSAVRNLARASTGARLLRCDDDHGVLVVAKTGDGLDSSRILLPGLHDVLAPELGSPFAVAVPHRDALFACSIGSGRSLGELRDRAAREAERAAQSITHELFAIGPSGRLEAI
jgi:hypothetical protein